MSETARQSCRTDLWVEPGTHPESSTYQIKIQPGPNNNEPEVQTHGHDRKKTWKDISGNRIDLIHKEPIMEFVSSLGTMPLQIYKAYDVEYFVKVFRHVDLHYWAGNVGLILTNIPTAHILIQTQTHGWSKLLDLCDCEKWLTVLRSSSLQALPNSTGPT